MVRVHVGEPFLWVLRQSSTWYGSAFLFVPCGCGGVGTSLPEVSRVYNRFGCCGNDKSHQRDR